MNAAWEIVRIEGLTGLSLRDLATTVGMQPPSLYSYFNSKNEIYDAMFRQCYEALLSRAALFDTTPGSAAFKARIRGLIEFCVEDPARYQLMFQKVVPGFTPSEDSYRLAVVALDQTHRQLSAVGVTSDTHRDLFTALLSGLSDQQIANDPGGDRWLKLVDPAVDMFLAHVASSAPKKGRKP